MESIDYLKDKAAWVKKELLKIHRIAPGIRLASSLSCVEILTTLYYGKIINCDPQNIYWDQRDRFIISKAHGSVSFYPILADFGFYGMEQLALVGKPGGILADIPDCSVPGYETVNGSLGHGLGVACGISLALKRKNRKEKVFVLLGDGELFEGSVWEAIMFATHHKLNNLILIIDNNKICMLDYCKNIINFEPIEDKFAAFGWQTTIVDGHNIADLYNTLTLARESSTDEKPRVIVANTVKGKGVARLETDSLCHIKALSIEEIDRLLMEMN